MNINTRTGKIARLPWKVREAVNHLMLDGWTGPQLCELLNNSEGVKKILQAEFAGHPITPQNLSEWRKGGYRDWLAQREAQEITRHLYEQSVTLQEEGGHLLSDILSVWVASRYAVATRHLTDTQSPEAWKQLRQMCADVTKLRRADQNKQRLQLQQERQNLQERDYLLRHKRKLSMSCEALWEYVQDNPAALKLFCELADLVRHPFDDDDPFNPSNPTNPDPFASTHPFTNPQPPKRPSVPSDSSDPKSAIRNPSPHQSKSHQIQPDPTTPATSADNRVEARPPQPETRNPKSETVPRHPIFACHPLR